MAADDIPPNDVWSHRWWRVPGESFLSNAAINVNVQVNAYFTWCHPGEWGVQIEYPGGVSDAIFLSGGLAGAQNIPREIVPVVSQSLRCRLQLFNEESVGTPSALLVMLAQQLDSASWMSGRRLRKELGLDIEMFEKQARQLRPRYLRRAVTNEGDYYSLTLPGLLKMEEQVPTAETIEMIYRAVAHRFDVDPDATTFGPDDLQAIGVQNPYARLIASLSEICLLTRSSPSPEPGVFEMPADREAMAAAARKRMSFVSYLTHAATEGAKNRHYPVLRPWPSAPLWLERDGQQLDCVPGDLLAISVRSPNPTSKADDAADARKIQVPGYVLLDALPGGAGGEVYVARENRDGGLERVIKVFVPHPFADDQDPEPRFRSEVEAILRLQHRAIVRYVSSGVLDGPRPVFYLVMELVKGARLQTRASTMPFEVRVSTMIEILDGLEHAHSNKIFHRDVKPSNIMIRDSDSQPVLVDFGLAYLVGDELDDDRTRLPLGTPGYIPPESSNNPKRSRDPRHDIYQAGVTLYVILAGCLPEPYFPLESTDPCLRGLDPIVKQALAEDPVARFASAADFASCLRSWVDERNRVSMLPPSPLTQRLRETLLARHQAAASHEQAEMERANAIRARMLPVTLMVEAAAADAFREVHAAISDFIAFDLLEPDRTTVVSPVEGVHDSTEPVDICSLTHREIERFLTATRIYTGGRLWELVARRFPSYAAMNDGRFQSPLWLIWMRGSMAPPETARALIFGQRLTRETSATMVVVGTRGGPSIILAEPLDVKNFVVETLAEILGL